MHKQMMMVALAAVLAGCGGDGVSSGGAPVTNAPVAVPPGGAPGMVAPAPDMPVPPGITVAPIQIDTVELVVRESNPPQVAARVKGVLGDGCTTLKDITQTRNGATIEITITSQRPNEAMCTMIAQIFDQTIELEGEFPAGEYIVRVNGVEQRIKI